MTVASLKFGSDYHGLAQGEAMNYVVAYDISDSRRRKKVMEKLKNFGLRVQYSVFECELDASRREQLKAEVLPLIRRTHDRLHVYRLCENCVLRSESFGSVTRYDNL